MAQSHDASDRAVLTFMCVRNAGRSQMATAFAERERDRRGLGDRVEIRPGGTHPADAVHDVVVEALAEVGLDGHGREPRAISDPPLAAPHYVPLQALSALPL